MSGYVDGEGRSAVPEGIVDMAALGDTVQLSAEVEERVKKALEGLDDPNEVRARYKLEVVFTDERSMHRPFGGFVTAWTNGGFAHGGGDEAVYFCTGARGDRRCDSPLELKWLGRDHAVCPVCRSVIDVQDLTGQVWAKLPVQGWTTLVTHMFQKLECDADLRIGMLRGDLIRTTLKEQDRTRASAEAVDRIRHDRRWLRYPLRNVLKDTAAGADLTARIRAFLTA